MRRQKQNKYKLTLITVFIAMMFLSIGYSYFSETLNISGFVNAVFTVSDDVLNVDLNQTNGSYTSLDNIDRWTLVSENLNENELTITYSRNDTTGRPNDRIFNITFVNTYPINLTSGTVSTQIISGAADIDSLSASLNKTAITPNEDATLTVDLRQRNRSGGEVLITFSYDAGGTIQYFHYRIIIQ